MQIIFLEAVQSYGGARKSTVELAKRLMKYHKVSIIDVNGNCMPFVDACRTANINLAVLDPKDKPFIIAAKNRFRKLFNYFLFVFYRARINNKLRAVLMQYDDYYLIVNNSKVLSFIYRKPSNAKIIFFARGWFVRQQISNIDRYLYNKLVDKYIAVSESTRQAIYGAGLASLQDIFVVHNAMNIPIDKTINRTDDCIRILFSGGFLPTKGHSIALGIAQKLKANKIKFDMVLTGIIYDGPTSKQYYDEICNKILNQHLDDNVRIVADNNDVSAYFQWCDIFCHPSDTEGLPRVVMEAMAYGKPVIANAVGGVTDYILNGYNGFITRHNNIDDYVECIMRLHNNPNMYKTIGERAKNLIGETYTESAQIEQFNRAIEQ